MKKKATTSEEYPDLNGNGVPDAFEHRKPLAEILGFDVPDITEIDIDVFKHINPPKPEPSRTWVETEELDELRRRNEMLEKRVNTLRRQTIPDSVCNHSQGNTPFLTCVHILKQGARIGFCENTAPSTLNHHIGVKICALKTHQPKDYCTACDKCMPRHLQGYETR